MGGNTKAAILRIGLVEMAGFTNEFFPSSSPDTFSHHSAGVADLITSEHRSSFHFIKVSSTHFVFLQSQLHSEDVTERSLKRSLNRVELSNNWKLNY